MTMTHTADTRQEPPRSAAEVLARAHALAPVLRERAEEIEQSRRLPADVVDLLRGTGVFRMSFGPDRGGPGLTSMEQTEVIEALAHGDASAAWCAMIGSNTGIFANFLDPRVAREMFPSLDTITAGLLQPSGRADRVPGGYRLTGRWSFGSGITHCDWVMSGAFVFQDGEPYASPDGSNPHESRQFMVPSEQVEIIDNWDTLGLRGSGSCDYKITDVFVPDEHSLTFDVVRGTVSPLATPEAFMRSITGVPLGLARAALDHAREVVGSRVDRMLGADWRDLYRVQTIIAECEADFNATRSGAYAAMTREWTVLADGGTLDDLTATERAAVPMAWLHTYRTARSIVNRLFDLLQTWSINTSSPMNRWLRDITTMCQHLVAQDRIVQSAGAHLVGGRPEFGICLGITG
ncbi:acyl-CoA dehydrogenase family protein [Umezawaea sp. Da 62-37]|uniref:acyl-CoA dehydrogenase family protein n=1 Tax=Umezawaea sp. Da 62-37 TaxID=3075927 RepID=UPI0028F71C1B|nr:acyl-CoA dehydrogenase family protein [Umezawaea sp. Da 62-37]WNV85224.1 acyl-CoA dehydrogenase family protein [Umezawaea sp. Da 62-37]